MNGQSRPVAVVTGGSYGLGLAMAKQLAGQGYLPVIIARDREKLDAALAEIRQQGNECLGFSCDVTDAAGLKHVADELRDTIGSVDFLILNAGVVETRLVEEYEEPESLKRVIDVDLWGSMLCSRIFLPLLRDGARILYVSSGFGLMGTAGYSAYCAAKAGVINFAATIRRELFSRNISVYVACPADMDTPGFRAEQAAMPSWMKVADARGDVISPEAAASKILRRCRGKRFLIVIHFEVRMLLFFSRLLPERAVLFILDRVFPVPH